MKKLSLAIRVWVCGFVISILLPSLASAQEQKDTISGKSYEWEEITVTARRIPFKITSTTSIQVLDKGDLRKLGFQNMGDAVKRFAGTNVRDYGGIGGLKTVSVRNLGAHIRLLATME